ncbi:MAG: 5'-nucleotidase C-terminal domain-containing protein [Bacteroidales bacterium]|nr:5'-nucleotidase C-terminal domain-containing protein [Bacteroidales bacterium]
MKSPIRILLLVLAAASSLSLQAQRVKKAEYTSAELNNKDFSKISWTAVTLDKRFDASKSDNLATSPVIAKYKPEVDKYCEPIGFCPTGLLRGYPVAPMSNWAVDAFREYAQNWIDTTSRKDIGKDVKIDFALMNFGGIRTEMPKGNVSKYDILSIFPFDNYLVIEEMDGDKVRMLMEFFAKTRGQVLSNVYLHIDGDSVKECLIGGKPIDDSRKYVVATIDFLFQGGDNLYPLKQCNWVVDTRKKMMDIFIEYIQNLTANGKKIEKSEDNRLVVENKKK